MQYASVSERQCRVSWRSVTLAYRVALKRKSVTPLELPVRRLSVSATLSAETILPQAR